MAAPPLSLREQIFGNLMTVLATITLANGYATELHTVRRGLQSPLEDFILPCALVLPVNEPNEYAVGVQRRHLLCTVRLWIDDGPDFAPSTLEALLADAEHALAQDVTRGGLAQLTVLTMTQYFYLEGTERLAGADMHYEIHYRVSLTDPRTAA